MTKAFVLINCDLGTEEDVIDDLKHIACVQEIHGTFGAYDIVATVEHADHDKLRKTIAWGIRGISKIRSTLTLMKVDGQN